MMLNPSSTRNRSPFTPTQWQELEQQALIYKYMISGVPIPPELIYSVKRSLESSLASRRFPRQTIGWGCFQVGYARKADPEPGRCRRTDGKKWRCSKEAYPDSKYCERHMHRGRNRSKKHVELTSTITTNTSTTTANTLTIPCPSINRNLSASATTSPSGSSYSFYPLSSSPLESELPTNMLNPFLYPQSLSSRPPPGSGFSPPNSTTHNLFVDSASFSHAHKDFRYFHGTKEGLDERAFFPEASGSTIRSLQDSYHQATRCSYKGYSQTQFESLFHTSKRHQQDDPQQHCFVLGTDFKSSTPRTIKLEKDAETQKPLRHFFGEWSPKNADSWLDLASKSRLHNPDS